MASLQLSYGAQNHPSVMLRAMSKCLDCSFGTFRFYVPVITPAGFWRSTF